MSLKVDSVWWDPSRSPAIEVRLGAHLRAARERLRLTQARTGELLGTQQGNISAYEHGRLEPGPTVASRIEAFVALPEDSVYSYKTWANTMASTALRLREDVRKSVSESAMLRTIIQASDDFQKITAPADRALFLAEPGGTGDERWDAMIAGLAVHLCRQAGLQQTPAWTRDPRRFLAEAWWFDFPEVPALNAHSFKEAVPSLRTRGVMFGRRNLESV